MIRFGIGYLTGCKYYSDSFGNRRYEHIYPTGQTKIEIDIWLLTLRTYFFSKCQYVFFPNHNPQKYKIYIQRLISTKKICDPIVIELIHYRTRAKRPINESNATGGLKKNGRVKNKNILKCNLKNL